jgi:predicted O-methyltransferase YrrM
LYWQYLVYVWRAKNAHALHSPFLYSLYTDVINDSSDFYCFSHLSNLREQFENDKYKIANIDFGAGSKRNNNREKSIQEITRHGITRERYSELLFRLVNHFNPTTIFELGTSVGLTTLYLAKANSTAKVTTFEGNPQLCRFSLQLFEQEQQNNIQIIKGNFDHTFERELDSIQALDFLFIDGNHRKEPTLRYFDLALKKKHAYSVFVFDDIHWSQEMDEAWNAIQRHPAVTLTIDLFQFGIVFFRPENYFKQHVVLRF